VEERPGEITVVAVGPLTNVALAILSDPSFARNVGELIVMGGAVSHQGNATSAAEANFSNDPEAAAAVTSCGAPLRLVDLGATRQAILPMEWVGPAADGGVAPVARFARNLLDFYSRRSSAAGSLGAVLHDPLAVGLAARPELATFLPIHLTVETAGVYARGASIGNFTSLVGRVEPAGDHLDCVGLLELEPNASVAREIDTSRFLRLFLNRLGLSYGQPT
jgi:purine nucleosidase